MPATECAVSACLKEWGRLKAREAVLLGSEVASSCVGRTS
jgi:hypothetical protein